MRQSMDHIGHWNVGTTERPAISENLMVNSMENSTIGMEARSGLIPGTW